MSTRNKGHGTAGIVRDVAGTDTGTGNPGTEQTFYRSIRTKAKRYNAILNHHWAMEVQNPARNAGFFIACDF